VIGEGAAAGAHSKEDSRAKPVVLAQHAAEEVWRASDEQPSDCCRDR